MYCCKVTSALAVITSEISTFCGLANNAQAVSKLASVGIWSEPFVNTFVTPLGKVAYAVAVVEGSPQVVEVVA